MTLTKKQRHILTKMRDEGEELVYETDRGYVGLEPVGTYTFMRLLAMCAISAQLGSEVGRFERYRINSTGLEILDRGESRQ